MMKEIVRRVKVPPIFVRKFHQEFSSDTHCFGRNLERRYKSCRYWGAGQFVRVRNPCSKAQCKRSINAQKRVNKSYSHSQMEQGNCGEIMKFGEPTLRRDQLVMWRSQGRTSETRWGLDRQKQKMRLKPTTTSGQWKETSFIVTTLNLEFSYTCRKKNHSQFHWSILTWSG